MSDDSKNDPTVVRLQLAIERQIDYFTEEYDLTVAETVAALEIVKTRWLYALYLPPKQEEKK